jgi:hypothetical protein
MVSTTIKNRKTSSNKTVKNRKQVGGTLIDVLCDTTTQIDFKKNKFDTFVKEIVAELNKNNNHKETYVHQMKNTFIQLFKCLITSIHRLITQYKEKDTARKNPKKEKPQTKEAEKKEIRSKILIIEKSFKLVYDTLYDVNSSYRIILNLDKPLGIELHLDTTNIFYFILVFDFMLATFIKKIIPGTTSTLLTKTTTTGDIQLFHSDYSVDFLKSIKISIESKLDKSY